jgi:plastocyanin
VTLVTPRPRSFLAAAARLAAAAIVVAALVGCSSGVPASTRAPNAVYVSAYALTFQQHNVAAPADAAFQIWFENRDSVPHNVNVVNSAGTSVARGEVFTGPSAQPLAVPSLPAGTYRLLCDVHPEMNSELTVGD